MQFRHLLTAECERQGLEADYMEALIMKESAGNPWVTRYEPGWNYFENPELWSHKLGQTLDTEINGQKISYGLCQVMGGTARWLGFSGYFPELCDPEVSIHFGCQLLAQKLRKHGSYEAALSAYNAGSVRLINGNYSNQHYVDDVIRIRSGLVRG